MANEVVNRKENYILVQVSPEGEEAVLNLDYRGQFSSTPISSQAYKIDDLTKAQKLASRLNSLNQLNFEFGIVQTLLTIKVAKQIVDVTFVDDTESV
ncbi:hypothetical protein [Staphylococcus warneri]|uniref:hypothetical protein n=1 Tax=Staphylococcus warneri TaxID=1292 RepID=UPI00107283C7|nr:hypothetical protein [Staphylococcus warneri]MBC3134701.1 hypothetical protein [Staphylococcus warneri]MBF0770393.1 hypothetical protein [Staphylococcus warneri]MCI2747093.1 hypothetical protein [Staphylococcus warneri]MCI2767686.1 hypothetical protein [Staphylococcus warneri]MCI2777434.1 hypothetical protein [Staphylococcus warneri]